MPFPDTRVGQTTAVGIQPRKLRLGVVLDSYIVPRWLHKILELLDHSQSAQLILVALVNQGEATPAKSRSLPKLFELWRQLDQKFFQPRSMRPEAFDPQPFKPQCSSPIVIECHPAISQGVVALDADDLAKIQRVDLDVLLHFSQIVPKEQLKKSAHCGVWSFDEPDALLSKVFWDMFDQALTSDSDIDVLTSTGERGTIPCACSAIDPCSLFRNYSNLCWKRSTMISQSLDDLYRFEAPYLRDSIQFRDAPSRPVPGNLDIARLLAQLVGRAATRKIRSRLFREQWFIAYRRRNGSSLANTEGDLTIVRAPSDHFYADPFVIDRGDKSYIFFEDLSFTTGKGIISFVELDPIKGCSSPEPILEESYHLSYPCLFEWQGDIYMLPETKDNRTVQLYRATQFPHGWQLVQVLLPDVAAVDSTLLHHDGRFWLLASGIGTSDPWFNGNSELFLFFSDSLFGRWMPHPKNPVVSDIRRCRPAGHVFSENGQLIRPAQNYSAADGYAVTLNLVDVLSETDYHETPVARISPAWMKGNLGTHTFNRSERYEVWDGRTLISRMPSFRSRGTLENFRLAAPLIRTLA